MVFHCFRDGKCEWEDGNLRDFIAQFNQTFGSEYVLVECLDVSDSSHKQPEILLKWEGHQNMVIERKKIVYPPNYYQLHRLEHNFYDACIELYKNKLESVLPEDVYLLEVEYLPKKKKKIEEAAEKIVDVILEVWNKGQYRRGIKSRLPMPWCFQSLPAFEREPNTPDSGIIIRIDKGSILDSSSSEELLKAEKYIENKYKEMLKKAEDKFINYSDCIRIMVLELSGDELLMPELLSIDKIFRQVNMPVNIDQIWVAEPEYNDDSGLKIEYIKVH